MMDRSGADPWSAATPSSAYRSKKAGRGLAADRGVRPTGAANHDSTNHHRRAAGHTGESVQIAGWLYNLRRSGKIAFPDPSRRLRLMQCVAVKAPCRRNLFETIKNLTQESSIIVTRQGAREQRARAASIWPWKA